MTDRAMAPTDANAASDSMLWAFADVQASKSAVAIKNRFTSVLACRTPIVRSCPSCVSPCTYVRRLHEFPQTCRGSWP